MSVASIGSVLGGSTTAGAVSNGSVTDTQDNFMKLLITQLRNQDPLNPMDNSQMTSQLAQLNMVSGINQLNKTLSGLSNNNLSDQAVNASALLGREVLVPGNGIQLTNGQGKFGFDLDQPVDELKMTIYDSQGNSVDEQNLGPQQGGFQVMAWDGATTSGVPAVDGNYIVKFKAQYAGKEIPVTALTTGNVQNISLNSGVLKANVGKAGDISLSDIKQIF